MSTGWERQPGKQKDAYYLQARIRLPSSTLCSRRKSIGQPLESFPHLCSERGTRAGQQSRPWCTPPPDPTVATGCPASTFSLSARGGADHANQLHLISAHHLPRLCGGSGHTPDSLDGGFRELLEAPAETAQGPCIEGTGAESTHCAQAQPPAPGFSG